MKYTDVKNLKWADAEQTLLVCEVKFVKEKDFIPFTAVVNDVEDYSVDIFNRAVAGDFGKIADYTPPTAPVLSKGQLKQQLMVLRYKVETGGFVWDGKVVKSDDRSQGKLLAELLRMSLGIRNDLEQWKFGDNKFRKMSNSDMQAMFIAGVQHVQKCFACEARCQVRIDAGETDLQAIWNDEWSKL